jgi:hypothetical protein
MLGTSSRSHVFLGAVALAWLAQIDATFETNFITKAIKDSSILTEHLISPRGIPTGIRGARSAIFGRVPRRWQLPMGIALSGPGLHACCGRPILDGPAGALAR